MKSKKALIISVIYFIVTSFTIIGNPFAKIKVVTIPIFGILLTLPWSLILPKLISLVISITSVTAVNIVLEICAIINTALIFFLINRFSK